MIYGTFLQSPFYWYLIFWRQKNSFFLFWYFMDLTELKKAAQGLIIATHFGEFRDAVYNPS
jgi:hypothetical protein